MRARGCGVVSVILAVGFLAVGVETAWAAPPTNDTFDNATVISSLPFSDTVDTTQATSDATDTEAGTACGFGGVQLSATVWYAFTPSADQTVIADTAGTNYFAGVAVVTGLPGSFSAVTCSPGGVEFVAHAGQTYHMDAVGIFATPGGALDFSVTGKPTPVFTVDPSAHFSSRTGAATVTGSLSCPVGFSGQSINLGLSQRVGRGAVSGSASVAVSCGAVPQPWSITIQPPKGSKFTGGHADVAATFVFCDQFCGIPDSLTQSIKLRS